MEPIRSRVTEHSQWKNLGIAASELLVCDESVCFKPFAGRSRAGIVEMLATCGRKFFLFSKGILVKSLAFVDKNTSPLPLNPIPALNRFAKRSTRNRGQLLTGLGCACVD
jgi:hypothetical protein